VKNNYTVCDTGLPCCDHATSSSCRASCRDALLNLSSGDEDMINQVTRHCGMPDPSVCIIGYVFIMKSYPRYMYTKTENGTNLRGWGK